MAKISSKMTQNSHFWTFFVFFFHKLSIRFERNTLRFQKTFRSLSTPYKGLICTISSKLYDWDSSESDEKSLNPTPLPHMRLLFKLKYVYFFAECGKDTFIQPVCACWQSGKFRGYHECAGYIWDPTLHLECAGPGGWHSERDRPGTGQVPGKQPRYVLQFGRVSHWSCIDRFIDY